MEQVLHGKVAEGFGYASGRAANTSPFSDATLRLQHPHFLARGVDLRQLVPDMFWGTINVELDGEFDLVHADHRVTIDWAAREPRPESRVAPELFQLLHCRLIHRGAEYAGLVYYPHPSTKPATNAHRYDVVEIIAPEVPGLANGDRVAVICHAGAFVPREN